MVNGDGKNELLKLNKINGTNAVGSVKIVFERV